MVLPFLCVGSFGAVPESMPCRLGPRGRVSGQWNNSLSGRCLAGFQVGARGQVSPPVVLLTVSLREMWEVCSVSRGEYREAGSSDGGCVLGLLSSGHNSVPPWGARSRTWMRELGISVFALDLAPNLSDRSSLCVCNSERPLPLGV